MNFTYKFFSRFPSPAKPYCGCRVLLPEIEGDGRRSAMCLILSGKRRPRTSLPICASIPLSFYQMDPPEVIPAFNCEFNIPGHHSHLRIRYDAIEYFENVYRTASMYTHNNLLRSFSGGSVEGGGYIITYCQCITLPRYTEMENIYKCVSLDGGGTCILPDSKAKLLVRDLLTVVKYFHDRMLSFGGLELCNVVIVEGTLKLVGVRTFPLNNARKTLDFKSIANIIRFLYDHRGESLPAEFEALINLLESEWEGVQRGYFVDYSDLIFDHPSTWDMGRRESFMKHVCDWSPFVEDGPEEENYEYALGHLNLPWSLHNWQSRVPARSPLASCFAYPGVHYNNSAADLSRFIRNAYGHLAGYSDQGRLFKQEDIDDMLSAHFPMFLVELQTQLFPYFGAKFFLT